MSKEPKSLADSTAELALQNFRLELKYGKADSVPPPQLDRTSGYTIHCSVCKASGPPAPTIYEAAMFAQRTGFTYDSKSLRAGRKVTWYCEKHKR